MLFTDFILLVSDDETNRYAELKRFGAENGIAPEDLCSNNGVLYYQIFRRKYTQAVFKKGVFFVNRRLIKDFLNSGHMKRGLKVVTDYGWYHHRRLAEKLLFEIAEFHGWKIPKRRVHIKFQQHLWTHAYYEDGDFNTMNLKINYDNPEGLAWVEEDGIITEVEIPQSVIDKIIHARRPVSRLYSRRFYK